MNKFYISKLTWSTMAKIDSKPIVENIQTNIYRKILKVFHQY